MSSLPPLAASLRRDTSPRPNTATPEKVAMQLRDALKRALDTPASTRQVSHAASQSRKDAAKVRITELKQRIDMLQRFSGIGKGNPQQITQLARELKSLVAQYAGMDGGGGTINTAATLPAVNNDSGTGAVTADATVNAAAADATRAATQNDADNGQERDTTAEQGTDTPHEEDNGNRQQRMTAGGNRDDQDFFAQAKILAHRIKAMLMQENRQLRTEADQKKLKEARDATQSMEQMLHDAEEAVSSDNQTSAAATQYDATGSVSTVTVSSSVSVYA